MLDEPAFSPDGQRIAVESLDAEATPQGLYTIAVNGTHTLTPVPNTAGLATPDWVDTPGAARSTTIVAATIADGGLLTLVNSGRIDSRAAARPNWFAPAPGAARR